MADIIKEIKKHLAEIKSLCVQHKVKKLFVFGSVLTGRFNKDSDIDLIVEISSKNPFEYSDNYFELKFQLERLLKRPIDLLEQKMIKNPYLKSEIDQTKVLVYGK